MARMEEGRGAFKILTGKATGKRSLGMPKHGWIFKYILKPGVNTVNWNYLTLNNDYCECDIDHPVSILN